LRAQQHNTGAKTKQCHAMRNCHKEMVSTAAVQGQWGNEWLGTCVTASVVAWIAQNKKLTNTIVGARPNRLFLADTSDKNGLL
jgi:hypothetical protein